MRRPSSLFTDPERRAVEAAVTQAERGTCGQIVPVVASASGRYDRAEDLFGLVCALGALAGAWLLAPHAAGGEWSALPATALGLPAALAAVVAGFVGGAALATRFPLLRRPFVPRREMVAEVERAARAAFHDQRIRSAAAGILIYVSLYERMVRVIGDDAVAAQVSDADWQAICAAIIDGMRDGTPAAGLIEALQRTGSLLARALPRDDGDSDNALADALILID